MTDWNEALAEQAAATADPEDKSEKTYVPESLPSSDDPETGSEHSLDLVLDIPVTVAMEVGRGRIPIRSLLQLSQGSIVELDRLAGEPMDVLVNGTLVAQGEVVVVNDKYGIRLTDVISPSERIRRLQR